MSIINGLKRTLWLPALLTAVGAPAQQPAEADSIPTAPPYTIVNHIEATGKATVVQPMELARRLAAAERRDEPAATPGAQATAGGYRVLIFSSNNSRTAQTEARTRADAVSDQYPEWNPYIIFEAPYWRVKVGDFRSFEEASTALNTLRNAFPQFSREMRLMRDRIKLPE